MAVQRIQIPYNYVPRDYQLPIHQALDAGYKRILCRWHRRAGKDKCFLNLLIKAAVERVGVYYYIFPTASLGRDVIWRGIDKHGLKFLDHFPPGLVSRKNEATMTLELANGSLFQVRGSDKMTTVGPNPCFVVFSEFALQDPMAWELIRPILAENDGIAIFNSTPRGFNHMYDLEQMNKFNEKWYISVLTVEDTDAIPMSAIEDERRSGMDEDTIQQEFYVSYNAAIKGAYYGHQMLKVKEEKRICRVPYDSNMPVHTVWDLGIDDATTIWFWQRSPSGEIRVIDYECSSGEGLSFYIGLLKTKEYVYGDHWAPHDIKVRELGTGKSRLEVAQEHGVNFQVVPRVGIMDGIDAVRAMLGRCWFDEIQCEHGLAGLQNYRKKWDEKNKVFQQRPLHDWCSHPADAFRYLAIVEKAAPQRKKLYKIPKGSTLSWLGS